MGDKKKWGRDFLSSSLFFILIMMFMIGFDASPASAASGVRVIELYDPYKVVTKGPYYKDNVSYDSYNFDVSGTRAASVTYTSHTDDTFQTPLTTKTYVPSQYGWTHFTGMGFNCNTSYIGVLHDSSGNVLVRVKMVVTGLKKPLCNSEPDGDMGSDGDLGDGTCDACGIFDCPEWDAYMGKLDDIKNAIPPAPDWYHVSKIFSDAIVPRLVDEMRVMLDDLLGRAPEPPPPPPNMPTMPDLPDLDDGGFKDQEPDMPDSGVKGFDEDEIKDNAPDLKYEEDDTGGFNLSTDPVDALPDVVPGGDPGPYKRDPIEMPAEYPGVPKDNDVDIGKPPNPNDGGGKPPIPGDNNDKPPVPGDDGLKPPNPGNGPNLPDKGYKPRPN